MVGLLIPNTRHSGPVYEPLHKNGITISQITHKADTVTIYLQVDEFWNPKSPDLETLKVTREIPGIIIVLSRDPLPGSTQQNRKSLETFLNVSAPPQQQQKSRKSSGQRNNKNQSDSLSYRNKKSKDSVSKTKENRAPKSHSESANQVTVSNTPTSKCDKESEK